LARIRVEPSNGASLLLTRNAPNATDKAFELFSTINRTGGDASLRMNNTSDFDSFTDSHFGPMDESFEMDQFTTLLGSPPRTGN
jgi:hypothetical protein